MSLDHQDDSENEAIRAATKIAKYARKGKLEKLTKELESRKYLLNCTDDRKRSPLFLAAYYGNVKCVKELLKRGADPNQ